MRLLAPTLLLFALLALPILLLYMLKLRRRDVPVSSTLLWEMLLRDRQANAPWQKLKRNLLLFLQLLVLAALVFALARPAIPVPAVTSRSTVVILDASASMHAADVEPTRFAAALASARQMVNDLPPGSTMTIIVAGRQPEVIASQVSDKTALAQALDSLSASGYPENGAANWEAAFALAAGSASAALNGGEDSDSGTSVVIISDGGLPANLPTLPGEVRYVPVGESGENLAISALALRLGAGAPELFARLTNYGLTDRLPVLSLYRDGELFSAQQVEVPAGESANLVIADLPAGQAVYEARLSLAEGRAGNLDPLPLDDVAFAVYTPPGERSALLFPSQIEPDARYNLFLQQALLAVLGEGSSFQSRPGAEGELVIPEEPFSLYVFDGLLPETLPEGNLLLVNPPSNPLFEVTGTFTVTGEASVADHPLSQFVDWSGVSVLKARQVHPPDWATLLVRAEGGPLVFAGETGGRRVAVITFDLHDSDLPLQVAFPILFNNLLNYLVPAQAFEAPEGMQPGDSVPIQGRMMADGRPAEQVVVVSPSGKTHTFRPDESGLTFAETGELGVYAVNYLSQDSQAADFFAVNLFLEGESRLAPAANIQVGRSPVQPGGEAELGLREAWPWLATLALLVLMVEWWLYHRRQSLAPFLDFNRLFRRAKPS